MRIEKLDRGGGALGVEIVRSLADLKPLQNKSAEASGARVVALSPAALASENLSAWLDQLTALDAPLIVCVSSDGTVAIQSETALAQAHIDLLAIEQNAWKFSSDNPKFAVVGTRTELDWASKNQQACVWAPSKFVMDAVESPLELINDPAALAHWLSVEIGAIELVLIGEEAPKDAMLPCRNVSFEQLNLNAV